MGYMKTCAVCGEVVALADFRTGRSRCKRCVAAYNAANYAANREQISTHASARYAADPEKYRAMSAAWAKANPDKKRAGNATFVAANPDYHRNVNLKRYGLTPAAWDAMLAAQDGKCSVCATSTPGGYGTWHIDHDHACCSGVNSCGSCVRGLLCARCNLGLGYFNDSPDTLASAMAYLLRSADRVGSTH